MEKLTFGRYVFHKAPKSLSVRYEENISSLLLTDGGRKIETNGRKSIVISGEGYLIGKAAVGDFLRLRELLGKSRKLSIPGLPPMNAYLAAVEMSSQSEPEKVLCSFSFIEDSDELAEVLNAKGEYTANDGDSLLSVANELGADFEALRRLNTQIEWINHLEAGEAVKLP